MPLRAPFEYDTKRLIFDYVKLMSRAKKKAPTCYRCKWHRNDPHNKRTACTVAGVGCYDIEVAIKAIKRAKRKPVRLTPAQVALLVREDASTVYVPHLAHVDLSVPVILAREKKTWALIEGHHRASRAYLEGVGLLAYKLTAKESLESITSGNAIKMRAT